MGPIIVVILLILGASLIDFLVVAALVKLASIIFGFVFTWAIVAFIWLLTIVLGGIFKNGGK